jgi:methionyl-tRNA synthetase
MISPLAMRERYGFEAFRYFLLREMSFGLDANFSEEALVERVNADLANNLGNLVSRTLNLVEKLCGGVVPEAGAPGDAEREVLAAGARARRDALAAMQELRFHEALGAVIRFSSEVNRYVDGEAPWKAAKQPDGAPRVARSLATACQAIGALAELLGPFLPVAAARIAERVGAPGSRVRKGDALFPRLELRAGDG